MKLLTITPANLFAYYRHKFVIEQKQEELRNLQIQARSSQKVIAETQQMLNSIITK